MSPHELAAELKRGKLRPAYLFIGEEDLLKEDALEALRRAAGRGGVRRFEGSQASAADILEAQRNFSLLDPAAVIVVRSAGKLPKAATEALLGALAEAVRGSETESFLPPLVFWDVTLRGALFTAVEKSGGAVDFRAFTLREAQPWVVREAARLGHRLAPGVAELLVESVGPDLMKLRRGLEVLSLYVGPGAGIDESAVAEVVPAARSHAMYELQDALSSCDAAKAIGLLRAAMEEGQEPPLLVGVLFAELRRLLRARDVPRGTEPPDLAKELGCPSWKVSRLLESARRFRPERLRSALERLADIDVALKTGRCRADAALEDWVLSLCASPSRSS
ncbi:MAG: DNA polymerase III subunit delta [Candidatus Binatia bacterium]